MWLNTCGDHRCLTVTRLMKYQYFVILNYRNLNCFFIIWLSRQIFAVANWSRTDLAAQDLFIAPTCHFLDACCSRSLWFQAHDLDRQPFDAFRRWLLLVVGSFDNTQLIAFVMHLSGSRPCAVSLVDSIFFCLYKYNIIIGLLKNALCEDKSKFKPFAA